MLRYLTYVTVQIISFKAYIKHMYVQRPKPCPQLHILENSYSLYIYPLSGRPILEGRCFSYRQRYIESSQEQGKNMQPTQQSAKQKIQPRKIILKEKTWCVLYDFLQNIRNIYIEIWLLCVPSGRASFCDGVLFSHHVLLC